MLVNQTPAELTAQLTTVKAIITQYETWIAGRGQVDSYTRGGITVNRAPLTEMQAAHSYWVGRANQIQMQINRITGVGFTGKITTRICR